MVYKKIRRAIGYHKAKRHIYKKELKRQKAKHMAKRRIKDLERLKKKASVKAQAKYGRSYTQKIASGTQASSKAIQSGLRKANKAMQEYQDSPGRKRMLQNMKDLEDEMMK